VSRRVLPLLLAIVVAGCAVVSPRQTLAVDPDGTVVFSEGRKDICLAVEDGDGERIGEVCDVHIDPLTMGEAALFHLDDRVVLVAVLPLEVVEVRVEGPGDGTVQVLERIESDITTGFAVTELDPDTGPVELVGIDADDGIVDRSPPIELPPPGEVTAVRTGATDG
jgi:hypothetical protein